MIFSKIKPIIMAIGTASLVFSASNVFAGGPTSKIIVNEFLRAGNLTTGNEFAELVLMQDFTAAQLNTYFFGDSTGSTAAKFSGYQFTNMENIASTFCAGTIITIGGATGPAVDTVYDPATGDWNITLQTAGANLTGNGSNGDFAAGDVAYVDTDGTNGNQTISVDGFAVAWDTAPGTFATNSTVLLTDTPNNNTSAFLNDVLANAGTAASWLTDQAIQTPGVANGGTNSTSIAALQAGALGTATIADSPTMNEGNAGNTAFIFTVTRTASCAAASVDYAVTGTGANPADAADFGGAFPAGTVNFAAGATTTTITVNVSGDSTVETDETFLVTISNPAGVALGATTTDTGTITNDDVVPVVATAVVDNNVSINGGADGQATASGSGGTPGYTYLWDDVSAQTTATATGLVAGTYTVTVTDSTGSNSDSDMVTITEPTVLTSTASVTDETAVDANDGTATVVAAGGVGPYTYLWNNGATTATVTGLMPGTYTVVVTDANGAISSPAAPIVVAGALPPAIIPTLNQYMLMLLMLLLGVVAFRRVKT